jgi:lipopolysaccharide biosynthesis glycosyltransferase
MIKKSHPKATISSYSQAPNIVFCFDSKIIRQVLIAVASCIENLKNPATFYFVATPDAEDKFLTEMKQLEKWMSIKSQLYFHWHLIVPTDDLANSLPSVAHLPQASCLRLFLDRLLPSDVSKVIYLDSDILVTADLQILMDIDMLRYPVAAAEDQLVCRGGPGEFILNRMEHGNSKYFNAGVLIIDLMQWKAGGYGEQAVECIQRNPSKYPFLDQDALNEILKDNWFELSKQWNLFSTEHIRSSDWIKLNPLRLRRKPPHGILHFPGGQKPWCDFCYSHFRFIYRKLAKEIFPDFKFIPCNGLKQSLLIWVPAFCYNFLRSVTHSTIRVVKGSRK